MRGTRVYVEHTAIQVLLQTTGDDVIDGVGGGLEDDLISPFCFIEL